MRPQYFLKTALVVCLVGVALILCNPTGFAQQGKGPGGGGHTEAAVNNLSYPAVMIGGTVANPDAVPLESDLDALGETYSYGCDTPQTIGTTTYPNYSCIKTTGEWMTALECEAEPLCGGAPVSRIYWQKIPTSYWKAQETPSAPEVTVQYLDWADNLESKSWTTTSTVRVETTPFHDYTGEFEADGTTPVTKTGYQMWHVSGQGTDEVWGVRAGYLGEEGTAPTSVFAYDSPYSIIQTTQARINISKLEKGASACPTVYTPMVFSATWDGSGWGANTCTLRDEAYTAELNVGGKYVYGYNWAVRRDALKCEEWEGTSMAGWWRITFYTPGMTPAVRFDTALTGEFLSPPTVPAATDTPLVNIEAETGAFLYKPVVDPTNNLTYIDICLNSGKSGAGRK